MKFSRNLNLPDYLEEALAPFSWSGVLSDKLRRDVLDCILATNRKEITSNFIAALRLVKFLDAAWVEQLCAALSKFSEEGFVGYEG